MVNLWIEWSAIITNNEKSNADLYFIILFTQEFSRAFLTGFSIICNEYTGLYTWVCVVCILYIHGPHTAPWECAGIPAIIQLCFFLYFPKVWLFPNGRWRPGGVYWGVYTGTEERQCDIVHVPLQFNLIWLTALYVTVLHWLTAVYIRVHPTLRYAYTCKHISLFGCLQDCENMADKDLSSVKSIVPYDLMSLVGVFTIVFCDNCEIQYPNLSWRVFMMHIYYKFYSILPRNDKIFTWQYFIVLFSRV